MDKKICYTCTVELYSALIKARNPAIFDNLDEPQGHFAKWNKPDTEGKIHDIPYMRNKK